MYSLLAVMARVPPLPPCIDYHQLDLNSFPPSYFLPSPTDVSAIRLNLVSKELTKYIKVLQGQYRSVMPYILYMHSTVMAQQSEIAVLNVLYMYETICIDMIDII